MKKLTLLLIPIILFWAGSPVASKTKSTLPIINVDFIEGNLADSIQYLDELSTNLSSANALSVTYIGSNAISAKLEGDLKDNIPGKMKSEQIKVVPSSGSYQGGCMTDDYFVEISGANFGNGWDIDSVTICGVRVCKIMMQSSDIVVVYPNAGTPGTGDIVITSKSLGKTIIHNGFTYQVIAPKNQAEKNQAGK